MKFETLLLHNGSEVDPYTGASSIPIYQASTYHQPLLQPEAGFDYARGGNPTRQALENSIARLEEGCQGFAFASGMAAISTVFLLFSPGDHILVPQDVYGGTYRILTQVFRRLGIEVTFVDMTDPHQVEQAIRPQTKAIYAETPSNPTLQITDLRALADIAGRHQLLSIVDNTFMTPYYQRPLTLGWDIVIHSATKFIGGHSDVVAGLVVVKDQDIARQIKLLQVSFGAILGVQDSWLLLRGLKTLSSRLTPSSRSATLIAQWLDKHPAIERVYYPGLPTHAGYHIQQRQADSGGAVLSFDVGSGEKAKAILKQIQLPLVAVSLGSVESILSYPAQMSHAAMPASTRRKYGITDGLLRLSVGLEDPEDLINDLDQAIAKKVLAD